MNDQVLCDNCIMLVASRMTDLDIMVLSVMARAHPLKGLTLSELLEELTMQKRNSQFTKNRVYTTLLRMRVTGFLECQQRSQANYYFITVDGKRALHFICDVWSQSREE